MLPPLQLERSKVALVSIGMDFHGYLQRIGQRRVIMLGR